MHESLAAAGSVAGVKLRTSQLAIPEDSCTDFYATSGYEHSAANLAQTSLEGDMVFADGYASQLARVSGDADRGITLTQRRRVGEPDRDRSGTLRLPRRA